MAKVHHVEGTQYKLTLTENEHQLVEQLGGKGDFTEEVCIETCIETWLRKLLHSFD